MARVSEGHGKGLGRSRQGSRRVTTNTSVCIDWLKGGGRLSLATPDLLGDFGIPTLPTPAGDNFELPQSIFVVAKSSNNKEGLV